MKTMLITIAAAALSGCLAGAEEDPGQSDSDLVAKPPTFLCVSNVDSKSLGRNAVFRVSLWLGAHSRLSLQEGYLFAKGNLHVHQGPWTHFTAKPSGGLGEGGVFLASPRVTVDLMIDASGDFLGGTGTIDGSKRELSCYRPGFAREFSYDPASGTCKNAAGQHGMNDVSLAVVRETHDGECTVLDGALNDQDLGYPALDGWHLAGADLTHASLHFANLGGADLRGAKLATFSYGYAIVTGTVDAHTALPVQGCKKTKTSLSCFN